MKIIQQKRRKPCDVTHHSHLCKKNTKNFLFGRKPQENDHPPLNLFFFYLCLHNTFTCTCASKRPRCLMSSLLREGKRPPSIYNEGTVSHGERLNTSPETLRPEVTKRQHTYVRAVNFPLSRCDISAFA